MDASDATRNVPGGTARILVRATAAASVGAVGTAASSLVSTIELIGVEVIPR